MTQAFSKSFRRLICGGAGLLALWFVASTANTSETPTAPAEATGAIDFDCPDAPQPKFELDVGEGLFQDLFGLGEAAVAGVVEGLSPSAATGGDNVQEAATAEGLAAAQQVVQLIGRFVEGAHFSGYELEDAKAANAKKIESYYSQKLRARAWQTILRVRDGDEMYAVSTLRRGGGIKGVFIFCCDGDEVYLANIVCDISPENVKRLTSAAARMGMKVSANQSMLEDGMHMLNLKLNVFSVGE